MWKIRIMFSRHQLTLNTSSGKNNNNKLSSTQKINCVQQGDRRVHSSNCTTGLHRRGQTGRTPTQGHRAQGLPEGSERVPLSTGRWQPWLCHPQEMGPPSSSRAPGLLFLRLSLHVFWAAAVRGHLAKGSDSLKTTRQLQQQRNDLE